MIKINKKRYKRTVQTSGGIVYDPSHLQLLKENENKNNYGQLDNNRLTMTK